MSIHCQTGFNDFKSLCFYLKWSKLETIIIYWLWLTYIYILGQLAVPINSINDHAKDSTTQRKAEERKKSTKTD